LEPKPAANQQTSAAFGLLATFMRFAFRRKLIYGAVAAALLCLTVTGLILAAARRGAAIRLDRLSSTVVEIQRGNYFAWAQSRAWWEWLTEPERVKIRAACRQYARTNQVLHWKDDKWPPSNASLVDSPLRKLAAHIGLRSHALEYGNICLPAFEQVSVELLFADIIKPETDNEKP